MAQLIPEPVPVAFLTDLLSVGGAESQLVELTRALDPGRIRAEVIVLREGGELLSRVQVPVHVLTMKRFAVWHVLGPLRTILERGGFRAVYTTHVWSALFAAYLCGRIRAPRPQTRLGWICSEHTFRSAPASPLLERVRRRALRRADRLVAVSKAQETWLTAYLGCRPERIEVVPNGIVPQDFPSARGDGTVRQEFGIPPGVPIVVCVGRLSAEKGQADLLRAMERVGGHLLLVGDGPERGVLETISRRPELAGRVHFAGTRLDARPFLAAADLFCLPSLMESQGLALCEAMAAGLPVISTRVGGIPEVVEDGVTGLLVPPRDPERLASALRSGLEDRSWRERAGEAGRLRVGRLFSLEQRARKIEELLFEVLRETMAGVPAPGEAVAGV